MKELLIELEIVYNLKELLIELEIVRNIKDLFLDMENGLKYDIILIEVGFLKNMGFINISSKNWSIYTYFCIQTYGSFLNTIQYTNNLHQCLFYNAAKDKISYFTG